MATRRRSTRCFERPPRATARASWCGVERKPRRRHGWRHRDSPRRRDRRRAGSSRSAVPVHAAEDSSSRDTGAPERVPPPAGTDPESTHEHADLRKEVALDAAPKRDSQRIGLEADPQIGYGFRAADAIKKDHELASGFTCPECHGALWETADGRLVGYRCRVGHTFTQAGLLSEQARALEAAMWTAYTALEEHVSFVHRMVARNESQGNLATVSRLTERARDLEQRARLITNMLAAGPFAAVTGEKAPAEAREA